MDIRQVIENLSKDEFSDKKIKCIFDTGKIIGDFFVSKMEIIPVYINHGCDDERVVDRYVEVNLENNGRIEIRDSDFLCFKEIKKDGYHISYEANYKGNYIIIGICK